jgi:hypothetical protein
MSGQDLRNLHRHIGSGHIGNELVPECMKVKVFPSVNVGDLGGL